MNINLIKPTFIKYIAVGLSSAILEVFLFFILLDIFRIKIIISNSIAYTVMFLYNYFMQRKFAFKSTLPIKKQIVPYGILFIFNLNLSNGLIFYLTHSININPVLSKIIAMGIYVPLNFLIYKKIIFKK